MTSVIVDLEKLKTLNSGLGRFSLYLAQALLEELPADIEPTFLLRPADARHFERRVRVIPARAWRKEGVARLIRPVLARLGTSVPAHLWHSTNQMSKFLPLDPSVPIVLTVHDLNFLRDGRPERIAKERRRLQRRLARAAAITAISQFVADDVRAAFDLRGKPVHVIRNGLPPAPAPSPRRPSFMPEGPFLFAIGNMLQHKNFHILLDFMARLPAERLVIAGKKSTPYGVFLEREIAARGLPDRVILPGEVGDADRQWLYENCRALLFPSLTEGFGLPVLEAMQCGRPVFASRATSLPEVAGPLGFYWDGYEPDAMIAVFQAGMRTFEKEPGYAEKLRAHARTFSWRSAARGYVRVYQEVLASRPPARP